VIERQPGIDDLENNPQLDYVYIPVNVTVHIIETNTHNNDEGCSTPEKSGVKRIWHHKNVFKKVAQEDEQNKAQDEII
jgi:hypothetical protein